MSEKYSYHPGGLNEMLSRDKTAKSYFMSLPDYVQGMIQQRCENVHNIDELHRYAENLMAGDK